MGRTLLVTNDFPPRPGGIQAFVHGLAARQPPGSLVVYTSTWRDPRAFDARQQFEVVREATSVLLPTPRVARRARQLARSHGCDTVWFGAAAPLGLLAPTLRQAGVERAVAQTHGHEVGWAALPGARALLRRIAHGADVLTYLGEYTRRRLAKGIGGLADLAWLAPGVDTGRFSPSVDGDQVRRRYGILGRPVVLCVSRLVPRKGQDVLIRAMPAIRRQVPEAVLLLVGGGPDRHRLRRLAAATGIAGNVIATGSVPEAELPTYFAAGDVFAMPCRTRHAGLDLEGLGIVYLEASATGLPVVAGDSGGAPDAVCHGETGYVVDGRDVGAVAARVGELLGDPASAARMGAAGRAWVERTWQWGAQATRMRSLLAGEPVTPRPPGGP